MNKMEKEKKEYSSMSLEELLKQQENYIAKYASNGGSCKTDTSINDINMEIIKKYAAARPECYLGVTSSPSFSKIHPENLVQYTGQPIKPLPNKSSL